MVTKQSHRVEAETLENQSTEPWMARQGWGMEGKLRPGQNISGLVGPGSRGRAPCGRAVSFVKLLSSEGRLILGYMYLYLKYL